MLRYQRFCKYLRNAGPVGLLAKSLTALKLQTGRWLYILDCPFFHNHDTLKGWASEARTHARGCSSKAKEQAFNEFLALIEKSLKEGDGWLHRYARSDPHLPSTILIEAAPATDTTPAQPRRYISDPNEILKHHATTWKGHWQCDDAHLCEETLRIISNQILKTLNTVTLRKTFTPEQIRRAARSFKRGTATGADNWMLAEIPLMPNPVLQTLGGLLSDMQYQAIPPLQAFTNIMATLPKKDGGTRTVAIATTIYRLLMELDNEELEDFEATHAFVNDSANAGASGIIAAEDRALEAEMAHDQGYHTLTMLYDMKKFFDSINVSKLFEHAAQFFFPLKQLVLSMTVHHAPRRLKLGTALSEPISGMGRSILAGCKRSTQLARISTLPMVQALARMHKGVTSIYIHVDDISTLTKARDKDKMVSKAFEFATKFKEASNELLLDISDKTTVVPYNEHTRQFADMANAIGIPMSADAAGVDIGVDTSSSARRATQKQAARIKQARNRARRTATLAKLNHKARRLALTGVQPAHSYGHTAVGMSPTATNGCKRNIATATGMMGAGACATSTIQWAFRKSKVTNASADPRVRIPYEQVQSWMAMYHRMDLKERKIVTTNWSNKLKRLQSAKSKWMCIRGPIDATIATLLQAG